MSTPRPSRLTWLVEHRRQLGIAAAILIAVAVGACAAAISYAHQQGLAAGHGERGWTADVWPLTVEGIVLSAGLVLVIRRMAGRSPGWLVWVTMAVGALVTLAANIASAPTYADGSVDWTARLMNAWPPLAFLFATELLVIALRPYAEDGQPDRSDRAPTVSDQPVPTSAASDEDIFADVRRLAADRGRRLSRDEMIERYGIGATRATKIRRLLAWAPDPTGSDRQPTEAAT